MQKIMSYKTTFYFEERFNLLFRIDICKTYENKR